MLLQFSVILALILAFEAASVKEQDCGKLSEAQLRNREEITALDEYPWIARLVDKNGEFYCLGVLIGTRHVLTAAHCFTLDPQLFVVFGEWDSSNNITERDCNAKKECTPPPQRITIESIAVHPDYEPSSHSNDIAVLKLQKDVELTDYVQPICLPPAKEVTSETAEGLLELAGFARHSPEDKTIETRRQKMQFKSIGLEECLRVLKLGPRFKLTSKQICGYANGSGHRFSGASLMGITDDPRKFYLVGIATAGIRGLEQAPEIYTRVWPYRDWILENMKQNAK